MIDYTKEFCNYLISCGYPVEKLEIVEKILSRGLSFSGVKVLDDNKKTPTVIQVFALMSDRERQSHHLYPFYRTMNWGETKIKPSCSIATRSRNGSWDIYDAHNSSEKRKSHYLNYNQAIERYRRRTDVAPVQEIGSVLKYLSWGMAALILVYTILVITCPGLPLFLDGSVVSLIVLIAALILLPFIIPFIKGVSAFGIDVLMRD